MCCRKSGNVIYIEREGHRAIGNRRSKEKCHDGGAVTPILFIGEYMDGHADAYLITVEGLMKYDWNMATWSACS